MRILVLEDNDWNLELITAIVESAGHEVIAARTGGAALEMIGTERFDAAVLDISLPDIDGFEVTAAIRKSPETAHLPVLAVTAHALAHTRDQALEAGCDAFITKPIDRIDFLNQLSQCLRGKHIRHAS